MKAKMAVIALLVAILAVGMTTASMIIPASDKARENSKAPENSPAIGDNWDLERVDFIHYAKGGNNGKPAKPGKPDRCYKLMGVKWLSLPVSYSINPSNPYGLSQNFVTTAISTSAEAWDDETSSELFGSYDVDYSAVYGIRDFKNAIEFGSYPSSGVIAVTSVWYTRVGKQIVEFDLLFNTYYPWGDASSNPNLMDLQNIATHELGHAVGMNDIYTTSCSEVTMYGYSDYGDIEKRSLEPADIAGLQSMYG